uniref:Uncharacterized protein n=1 Tax=Amphiprion percula TaxID=161767 RepID=A0A3P8RPQ1_AMPPE
MYCLESEWFSWPWINRTNTQRHIQTDTPPWQPYCLLPSVALPSPPPYSTCIMGEGESGSLHAVAANYGYSGCITNCPIIYILHFVPSLHLSIFSGCESQNL